MSTIIETALFGGGCFWCLEAIYLQVPGVLMVTSGYTGGKVDHPSYAEVSTGETQHAEVIQIKFDPNIVSYQRLLEIFFAIHDPTTLNRQGHDVGTQYRSLIVPTTLLQQQQALAIINALNRARFFASPIVTEVLDINSTTYWPAEMAHQNYYQRNPMNAYCHTVIAPKLDNFKALTIALQHALQGATL